MKQVLVSVAFYWKLISNLQTKAAIDRSDSKSPSRDNRKSVMVEKEVSPTAPPASAAPTGPTNSATLSQSSAVTVDGTASQSSSIQETLMSAFKRISILNRNHKSSDALSEDGSVDSDDKEGPNPAAEGTKSKGASRIFDAVVAADQISKKKKKKFVPPGGVYTYDKDSLLQKAVSAFDKKAVVTGITSNAKEVQCKIQLEYIIEQTGSVNEDEFIERYVYWYRDRIMKFIEFILNRFFNSQKMTESLKAMQSLVDSKLAQLRTEHSELYGIELVMSGFICA